jgi:hypothetical protein
LKRITQRGAVVGALCAAVVVGASMQANANTANLPATFVGVNSMSGTCEPEYVNAGVGGSGGISYQIQGYAASTSTATQSTQVQCKIVGSSGHTLWAGASGFRAGNANVLSNAFTLYTLESFVTCVRGDYFDSSGTIQTSGWKTTGGTAC